MKIKSKLGEGLLKSDNFKKKIVKSKSLIVKEESGVESSDPELPLEKKLSKLLGSQDPKFKKRLQNCLKSNNQITNK